MASPFVASSSSDEFFTSRDLRNKLEDVEIRSLEGKLQLLDIQRQLSAVRCANFIQMLESSIDGRTTDADVSRDFADRPFRSRTSSRRSFELPPRRSTQGSVDAPVQSFDLTEDSSSYISRSRSSTSHATYVARSLGSTRSIRSSTSSPSGIPSSSSSSARSLRRNASMSAARRSTEIFR